MGIFQADRPAVFPFLSDILDQIIPGIFNLEDIDILVIIHTFPDLKSK
jgi:hypothetical protein